MPVAEALNGLNFGGLAKAAVGQSVRLVVFATGFYRRKPRQISADTALVSGVVFA